MIQLWFNTISKDEHFKHHIGHGSGENGCKFNELKPHQNDHNKAMIFNVETRMLVQNICLIAFTIIVSTSIFFET
jgi:hypothetical protein